MKSKVSVIMGVYNAEKTIKDAINSILVQTYTNWEFIICDDASTDNTYGILSEYKNQYPEKFVILKNEENSKLSYSLNRCLENATGYYIARMDADDISRSTRFEEQINFLKANEEIVLVGTAMQRFNKNGFNDILKAKRKPDKYSLKDRSPFNHATIMTYKKVYDELGGYTVSKRTIRSQDVDLWYRFFYMGYQGDNLQKPLYLVREDGKAIKRRTIKVRINSYLIHMNGYKLLDYPIHWYIKRTLVTFAKILTPYHFQILYRKLEKYKYKTLENRNNPE